MTRIVWFQDMDPMSSLGGAQLTDRGHIVEGLKRGHKLMVLTPQNKDSLQLTEDDFLVLSNVASFDPARFAQLPNRYAVFHHDMWFRCFVPGSFVYVDGVPEPIESIATGARVFGESGFVDVRATMSRYYQGMMYRIKPRGLPAIEVTPSHPILVVPGQVVRDRLRRRSYLNYNRKRDGFTRQGRKGQSSRIVSEIELEVGTKLAVFREAEKVSIGDYVVLPRIQEEENYLIQFGNHITAFDSEMAEVLGWYLAEGSATLPNGQIKFAFNLSEEGYAQRIAGILYGKFGLNYRFHFKPEHNSLVLVLNCRPLARWLLQNFGRGAANKCLPSWLVKSKKNIAEVFLKSYALGDGWYDGKAQKIVVTTASKRLAYSLLVLYAKLGLLATWQTNPSKKFIIRGKTYSNKGSYSLHISLINKTRKHIVTEDSILTPITKIGQYGYGGLVYDLETDGGVFAAPIVTHNCRWRLYFPMSKKCDDDCPQAPVWKPVLEKALLHIFLSPLHYTVNREYFGSAVEPHILVPSVVDPDEFFDYRKPGRAGTCSLNGLIAFKGQKPHLEYVRAHPEEKIVFAGQKDGNPELPPNASFVGPIAEGRLPDFYNTFETYMELPNTPQPFNRTVAEAYLSGCKVRGNRLVGALSWPWFTSRESVAEHMKTAPRDFWDALEQVL